MAFNLGECKNDHGGYLYDGKEKVIVIRKIR